VFCKLLLSVDLFGGLLLAEGVDLDMRPAAGRAPISAKCKSVRICCRQNRASGSLVGKGYMGRMGAVCNLRIKYPALKTGTAYSEANIKLEFGARATDEQFDAIIWKPILGCA
jgi:hypothetical protein